QQINTLKLYKQIKSLIPNSYKYPGWYIFKAPQRKISWNTLYTDLLGIAIFMYRTIFPFKKLQPISICTGIKNRSDNYLNHFLESLQHMQHSELIELSVFDCHSDDIDNLEQRIREKWKGKLVFNSENIPFNRSYTFNHAISQASNELILGCDADISLPPDMVKCCNQYVDKKQTWFPMYFFLFKNKPSVISKENGIWDQYGSRGLFACYKTDFFAAGAFNESYTVWGGEDIDLWTRFHQNHYIVIRSRKKGLFHRWHTTFNPKYMHMN
ncbi:MAG: galactosyltransferase-related protein, partial [Bacteroidota bacterium]